MKPYKSDFHKFSIDEIDHLFNINTLILPHSLPLHPSPSKIAPPQIKNKINKKKPKNPKQNKNNSTYTRVQKTQKHNRNK